MAMERCQENSHKIYVYYGIASQIATSVFLIKLEQHSHRVLKTARLYQISGSIREKGNVIFVEFVFHTFDRPMNYYFFFLLLENWLLRPKPDF